ncbi:MAG: FG-GAP-like repeat-containing protein [Microthrixaceae bacterium]
MEGTATVLPTGPEPSAHLGSYPVFLPRISDPRMHLALVTTTLQVLGQSVFRFELSIAQILISIATCAVIELAVTIPRDRAITWPASAMLTGNGIALIMRTPGTAYGDWWSLNGWWVFVGCAALAMASKYLIRVRGRHIFNPSNLALVATFVILGETRADPQVLWWGPLSVGLVIAFVVILAGSVTITRRVGQGHSAASFWIVFAIATGAIAASGHAITARWHVGPISGWSYWWLLVTSPEVLVFLFFMITDPKTAPRNRSAQVVFGSSIAAVGALIIATQSGEFGTKVGILAGLVLLCPFVWLLDARFSGDGRVLGAGARRFAYGIAGLVALGAATFLLGGAFGAEPLVDVPLERRSEVDIDDVELPPVQIDPDAVVSSITLDEGLSQAMAEATVEDLLLESRAVEGRDAELAEVALIGNRLAQAQQQIDAATTGTPTAKHYSIDSLTATVIRTGGGPQAPPRPAVRVTGEVTSADATEPLDATFTLVPVGDTWLIDDAYDADGNRIGPRAGTEPPIEAALEVPGPAPTAEQLDGLGFEDATVDAGLDLVHSDRTLLEGPAASSGGVAVGDYDYDGDPDVFLTRVGLPNALMRNDDGVFTDVTEQAGLGLQPGDTGSTGATFVDVTGDGLVDIVVLGLGRTPNRLYIGQPGRFGRHSGRFAPAQGDWALPTSAPSSADGAMFSLATADYDHDGRVDLLLAADDPSARLGSLDPDAIRDGADDAAVCSMFGDGASPGQAAAGTGGPSGGTVLLRNTGAGFEDRSDRLGVDPRTLVARAVSFADVNNDGFDDLLVAGGLCTTSVLLNDTQGGFTDTTAQSGIGAIHTANSSTVLDVNGDGNPDWFLTGVSYPTESGECPVDDPALSCAGNHLLLGAGDGTFTDATDTYGVREGRWGQGSAAGDFNLDGRIDLMMTSGFGGVRTARPDDGADPQRPYHQRGVDGTDRLWLNTTAPAPTGQAPTGPAPTGPALTTPDAPGDRWPEAAGEVGLDAKAVDGRLGKAVATLDYDGDNLLDLLVANTDGPPTLWRNTTDNTNLSTTVTLHDGGSANRFGIGAVVTLRSADGTEQRQRVGTDGSFQSGAAATAFFGMGPNPAFATVTVRWPDGTVSGPSPSLGGLVAMAKG